MIQRALAFLREARTAPIHPATAMLGAACVVLGGAVVQRFAQQQQAGLAHAWQQLRMAEHDVRTLERRWAEVDRLNAGYPAREDLDPVGRGDQADDPDVDERIGTVFQTFDAGTTEGEDR